MRKLSPKEFYKSAQGLTVSKRQGRNLLLVCSKPTSLPTLLYFLSGIRNERGPTSGDIFVCHSRNGCYWHLVGRGNVCYLTSYNTWSIQYVSKSGRLRSGHRTGKGQFSSQFPRRKVLKNVLPFGQLHSSPMLVRSCLKSCMLHFSIM